MDKALVGEFLGDGQGTIHEAEGSGDDHVKALASQGACHVF